MKSMRRKTFSFLVLLVTLFLAMFFLGSKSLAMSPEGASDGSESAISSSVASSLSEETSSTETSSTETSSIETSSTEEVSSATKPAGISQGYSFQGRGMGISPAWIDDQGAYATYEDVDTYPIYLYDSTAQDTSFDGGPAISPWSVYGDIEDTSTLPSRWDPYNDLNTGDTDPFMFPAVAQGLEEGNWYYTYMTFEWDGSDVWELEAAFESLYPTCYTDFVNYMNSPTGGNAAGTSRPIKVQDITNFMSGDFWTGYNGWLDDFTDPDGFIDSDLQWLGADTTTVREQIDLINQFKQDSVNLATNKKYYLDLNSDDSTMGKGSDYWDLWYYMLGYSNATGIKIYGIGDSGSASDPESKWFEALNGHASFDGTRYQAVIHGFGTPYHPQTDFYLFEDEETTITGFWGAQAAGSVSGTGRGIGGRTFGQSSTTINLHSVDIGAIKNEVSGVAGQIYLVSSFGGKLSVSQDSGIKAIDLTSTYNLLFHAPTQDLTLPSIIQNDVAGVKCVIKASPAIFGIVESGFALRPRIRASNSIDFISSTDTFTPSNTATAARVPIASGIAGYDFGSTTWHTNNDNITPNYKVSFTGTSVGNVDYGSFTLTGLTETSEVTVNPGTLIQLTTPSTNKATFTLTETQIAQFTSTEEDLQLLLRGAAVQNVTLNGAYNFSGTMSSGLPTVDSIIVSKGTTLSNTSYIVAGYPLKEIGQANTDGSAGNPYITNLIIGNNGSNFAFDDFDLRYSYAHNITLNDFDSTGADSIIWLPNIDYLPYQYDNSGVYSAKNTTITFTGTSTNLTNLAITGGEKLTEVKFDNPASPGSLGSQLKVLDLSWTGSGTPSSLYPRQLAAQPIIIGWTASPSETKNLIVKNTGITHFYSYENNTDTTKPMYPEDITGLDITNAGLTTSVLKEVSIWNKDYATPTGSTSQMTKLAYKDGNEASLEIINFNGLYQVTEDGYNPSTPVGASISYVFSKKAETTGLFLTALKEVHYDYLTQFTSSTTDPVIINLSDNKIAQFTMSNCIPTSAVASSSLDSLNLSGNELTIARNGQTLGVNGNQFSAFNTLISGTIDLSRNKLIEVDFDGSNNTDNFTTPGTPVNVFGQTIDLSNQQNQISVTELGGINWGNVSNGVKILNNDQLEVLNITSDRINGFELVNLPNLTNIEGTAHHGSTTITSPATLIVGKATFDNLGPNLAAPTSVGGAKELNFEGHGITYLTVQNMPDFDVLNFRRQNSTGDVAPAATQGALRTVNLVNGTGRDIDTIDVSYNSIERVTNGGVGSAFASVLDGSINYLGVKFVGNATVNADFNNITDVDILGTRFSGGDTLKTLRVNDNFLTNLTYTDSSSLTNLLTNRSEAGRNTFVNGKVILTNDSALLYFAPSTSVLADKDEDSKFNRVNPVIPSESRWAQDSPGGMTPVAADYSNMASGTFGTDFGFYTSVPITDLDISGCTSLTTLRVPGNHLTNNSLNWSNTGNMEFLDVSGAPYLTTDANGTHAGTSTTKPRGGRYTTVNVAPAGVQEAGSGQLTGAFIGQWPKLQSLYIQNNQIQQLDIGTSTSTVHILAYQNQLGQGLSSDAVKVSTATALTVLDVERNPNIGILTVPTQNLEILRAGLAGLKQYPNVQNISTLKQLYVDHNNLSGVAEPVTGNPNLEVLNIAGNAFTELPNVQPLAHLEEYYAYNNNATSLGTFNENGALAILDVADNLLSSWPSLPNSIVYLDLSRNRFGGVLDIPGVPAGLSRTTPYIAKAHEVTALENDTATGGSYYVQTSEFYGTFAIEDNQITALPDSLKQAFIDMKNNVSGRTVYRMFVNWNVLDIDVYGLDASGNPVPSFTGTQKWVAMYPGITPTLLNYVSEEKLEMVLRGSVGLYDPRSNLPVEDINAFEAPYPYQEWEYGWEETNDLIYNGEVDRSGVAIAKVRIIDNPGRNGRALVGINLYDHMLETNPDKKDKGGKKVVDGSQDAGEVLNDLLGDNSNYNPTTGAEGNK